jgi:predicted acyltransferase (DUF342 family)
MDELFAWRFLIFALLFGAAIYAHFYLAHRQWKRLKGEQATEIDVNYVRSETYFPQSFRMKVKSWINVPGVELNNGGAMIQKGLENIRVAKSLELPRESSCDEILVLEGDFRCGGGCRLRRELLVHGNCEIGADSHVQALAVDGDLTLGERVRIARWADSGGELRVSDGAQVASRVTSQQRIRLGRNAEVMGAHAPEVVTFGWEPELQTDPAPGLSPLEIVFPEDAKDPAETITAANLAPRKLFPLGVDTWLYKGDVEPPVPVRITQKLAVNGNCYLPAGSVIDADLRASGSIFLGPSCIAAGNLVAGGHVFLGSGCRFSGLIRAERTMLLSRGTRGFCADGMVAAHAGECLNLESNVSVKGKFVAGGSVTVVDAVFSRAWQQRHRIREDGSRLEPA